MRQAFGHVVYLEISLEAGPELRLCRRMRVSKLGPVLWLRGPLKTFEMG